MIRRSKLARLLRAVGRALIGWLFITSGYEVARAPGGRVDRAGPTLARVRNVVPLPEDDELLVRANGAAQLVAGSALALGVMPRLSATVLAGSLVPTSVAGHPFWEIDDPAQRAAQQIHFKKNAAMLGGLLLIVLS